MALKSVNAIGTVELPNQLYRLFDEGVRAVRITHLEHEQSSIADTFSNVRVRSEGRTFGFIVIEEQKHLDIEKTKNNLCRIFDNLIDMWWLTGCQMQKKLPPVTASFIRPEHHKLYKKNMAFDALATESLIQTHAMAGATLQRASKSKPTGVVLVLLPIIEIVQDHLEIFANHVQTRLNATTRLVMLDPHRRLTKCFDHTIEYSSPCIIEEITP